LAWAVELLQLSCAALLLAATPAAAPERFWGESARTHLIEGVILARSERRPGNEVNWPIWRKITKTEGLGAIGTVVARIVPRS
jgi:hypothetical protein